VKLPLDNFQVLGVSPSSSMQNILMTLERKLERCGYHGFSEETMKRRRILISDSSKVLIDYEKRRQYEDAYKELADERGDKQYLDIKNGYEVAGCILLLESRLFEECLTLAFDFITSESNHPRVNHNDLNELYLVIAYATLEYSQELKSKRYYEYCARILERGLRHLPDTTNILDLKTRIKEEYEEITPFRILDLLSRDMDDPAREDGIKLLNDFVGMRGGLDSEANLYMKNCEFKSFFRQIRYFLTVQEQIDLYEEWCSLGSQSACFLLAICLVASGFARRKPERLIQALDILVSLNSPELNEIIAYISLLLGNVEVVKMISKESKETDAQNRQESVESTLGELCSNCREWLERDVLEGYRDLEGDSDLEAYFSDRDVTGFIERIDSKIPTLAESAGNYFEDFDLNHKILNPQFLIRNAPKSVEPIDNRIISTATRSNNMIKHQLEKNSKIIVLGIGVILLALLVWYENDRRERIKPVIYNESKINGKTKKIIRSSNSLTFIEKKETDLKDGNREDEYKSSDRSMIYSVLSDWLNIKMKTLAGEDIPNKVTKIATSDSIKRLESERKEDKSRGEIQRIAAKVIDLKILRKDREIINVEATLEYSDERLDMHGKVLEKTPKHVFKKRYTLVKKDSKWLVQ
jgi:hypothetical protein